MDFFGRQDTLRWRTTVLLAAFLLAVAVIVVLIAGVAWVFGLGSGSGESPGFGTWLTHPTGLAVISVVTVYIGAVSLYRWHQLRQGGGNRVARLLGGRFIDPGHRRQRRARPAPRHGGDGHRCGYHAPAGLRSRR